MSRLIFVTTELHPETAGGAGVVIDALADGLGATRECLVLLLTSSDLDVQQRPNFEVIQATIPVEGFIERSIGAAEALAAVARPGDRVEIQDFEGIGFHALASRSRYGLEDVAVTVRFHGPYDLILDTMATRQPAMELGAVLEREVFKMADLVLIPVEGHREPATARYGIDQDRIVVSPPPIPPLSPPVRSKTEPFLFAVPGKVVEAKGSQDVVRAAVRLLKRGHRFKVRFVGPVGWSVTNRSPMTDWLEEMMAPYADSFEFTGPVDRKGLAEATADASAVLVASGFESFSLVAHESRRLELPVVVNDLIAFRGLFSEETGALVYDGSVRDLARCMRRLLTEPGLAADLGARPFPNPGDPFAAYAIEPQIRHPRSQAGLGTAAVKRLEAAMAPPSPQPGILQRIYRVMPPSIVNVGYRVLPERIKALLSKRASWSEEMALRQREIEAQWIVPEVDKDTEEAQARVREVDTRIAAGAFGEVPDPQVSVVIPVYNVVEFLDLALTSVYEQTFDSWEIIVVDDRSNDPSALKYLKALKRPRVRVIRSESKGLPAARNTGIAQAKGKYIIPLDADDEIVPTFMESMLAALETRPDAAYAHCYAILYHDVDAYWITRPFNPYWQMLGNGVVGCVLMRREAWEAVGGYSDSMRESNEDWELWLRLMGDGWDQVQVRESLFKYRKHGVSMSVVAESHFERDRRRVRDLHPELYGSLADLKRRWYPYITVVKDGEPIEAADIETVSSLEDLTETWGKFVVDIRGATVPPVATLVTLADMLETHPEVARAKTRGLPPLVMHRRWNLHDPLATPDGELVIDDDTRGPTSEIPTSIPRVGWSIPPTSEDDWRPIRRHRPEEAGRLPDISRW